MIVGVSTGARIVLILVMLTDKATSPLERKVITLLDVPPGHVPTRITPTVRAGSRLNILHNIKARRGIIVNWATQPIITSFGRENISLKSSSFNVSPIPNIIIIRSQLIQDNETHNPVCGISNVISAIISTITDIYFPTRKFCLINKFIVFIFLR